MATNPALRECKKHIKDTLKGVVMKTISPDEAAPLIITQMTAVCDGERGTTFMISELWHRLIASAAATAADQQDPLIDLLVAFKLDKPPRCNPYGTRGCVTAGLRELRAWKYVLKDSFDLIAVRVLGTADLEPRDGTAFVNFNAFLAQLAVRGGIYPDFHVYGLCAITLGLEDGENPDRAKQAALCRAAAAWFLYAGEIIVEKSKQELSFCCKTIIPLIPLVIAGKPMDVETQKGYSVERLELWKERLTRVLLEGLFNKEDEEFVSCAISRMNDLMNS